MAYALGKCGRRSSSRPLARSLKSIFGPLSLFGSRANTETKDSGTSGLQGQQPRRLRSTTLVGFWFLLSPSAFEMIQKCTLNMSQSTDSDNSSSSSSFGSTDGQERQHRTPIQRLIKLVSPIKGLPSLLLDRKASKK